MDFILWMNDVISFTIYTAMAIVVMLSINVQITFIALARCCWS